MPYCHSCGHEVTSDQHVCLSCGVLLKSENKPLIHIDDEGGFLWGLLGFMVPVAGLVVYLLWKKERPNTAKAAGVGALINLALGVVVFIIYLIVLIEYL